MKVDTAFKEDVYKVLENECLYGMRSGMIYMYSISRKSMLHKKRNVYTA
jgi:hypothetical protein